jgi:tRNA(adenine34) deaminase
VSIGGAAHERYMRRAIQVARGNPDAPFGCVIVDGGSGEILAEGLNDAERNPVLHGELAAIMNLAERHPEAERNNLVLYTTAEPCPMCAGAIFWAGIPRTVFGTSASTLHKLDRPRIDLPCEEVFRRATPGGFTVIGGVLEGECDALFEEMMRRS